MRRCLFLQFLWGVLWLAAGVVGGRLHWLYCVAVVWGGKVFCGVWLFVGVAVLCERYAFAWPNHTFRSAKGMVWVANRYAFVFE